MEKDVLKLESWHTPATDYPSKRVGNYRIRHRHYKHGYYNMWGIDEHLFFSVVDKIPITVLEEYREGKWHDWMVDDPPHWRAMETYAEHVKGNVLVGGLGLGLIIHALVKNPAVTDITVVERSQEVRDMVWPLVPKRSPNLKSIGIVMDDFYQFVNEQRHLHWDAIIADLWVAKDEGEKIMLLYREAGPTYDMLKAFYPDATIVLHGFVTVTDIPLIKPETVNLMLRLHREI